MQPDAVQKMLFVAASDKYGNAYIEHLLEQYRIYVAGTEKISDRRQKSNEFFLALNAALVTLLGFIAARMASSEASAIVGLSSVTGIAMGYLWYRMIRSYKGLNDGKFRVIHAIEQRLPLALYDTEWEMLGRGKDKNLYWPFTHIELLVPWIFISIYVLLILGTLPWSRIIDKIS